MDKTSQKATILLTHRHFEPHFILDKTHFSSTFLIPNPNPQILLCFQTVVLQQWMGYWGINVSNVTAFCIQCVNCF